MLNKSSLLNFSGSETFTKYGPIVLTQGMVYVAKNGGSTAGAGAFWLLDIATSYRFVPAVKREPFQVYKLTKNKTGSGAVVTVEDGNNNVVHTQRIPYTDFDFANGGDAFTFWLTDGTALLPSEY
jgi:hypothetical protein